MKLFLLLIATLLLLPQLQAATVPHGTVVLIKGNVKIQERPRTILQKGDYISQGETIVTASSSLIKVSFPNASTIFLGPNSSVKLFMLEEKGTNLINLLKGQIEAQYQKNPDGKGLKAIVKTNTAALGVRGTQFLVTYNPVNNITSSVTFEGHVSLIKNQKRWNDICSQSASSCTKVLDQALQKTHLAQIIPAGGMSQVFPQQFRPSIPVALNKAQFISLVINSPIHQDRPTSQSVNFEALPAVTKEGRRSGGIIDLKTSLYLEPGEGAILNKKTNQFQARGEVGKISLQTGEYIPPTGWKMNPNGNFERDKAQDPIHGQNPNHWIRISNGENDNKRPLPPAVPNLGKILHKKMLQNNCSQNSPCQPKIPGQDLIENGGIKFFAFPRAIVRLRAVP